MSRKETFKLKMALLRIWTFKNLKVFIKLAMYVLILAVLTGQIGDNAFVLNLVGLDQLSGAIEDTLAEEFSIGSMFLTLTYVISSAIVVIGTVETQARRIVLDDIKKQSTKLMLLRAGLYFNKDGKLVKRMEEAAKMDLDGDNKIGDTGQDVVTLPNENVFQGLKRSGDELMTIIKLKPESTEDVDKLIEDNDMADTAIALQEFDAALKTVDAQEIAEFTQSDEGKELGARINDIGESTLPIVESSAGKVGRFFKKIGGSLKLGTFATGRFFKNTGVSFVSGAKLMGKGIYYVASGFGGWLKHGYTVIGDGIKDMFTRDSSEVDEAQLAAVLAKRKGQSSTSKKVEESVTVVPVPTQQVKPVSVIKPQTKPQTARKDAAALQLEELRKKFGQ